MKKPILILLSLSLAVLFSIQEGRPAPKITNTQTIPFETNPFDLMEEDLILLGLPLESVSQEEKAHIIQNIEETVAHYSGENRTQLKMAAADALASVITNDDSIAGVGLVSRATGAAYNLNTHTPTLQKALWKVHFLENNRIDEQVMHHGQEIEDMAGLRFPAGKKPRPWHQALLSHQNSARALLIGLQNPDVHRAFDSVALLSPRTQEPTEEETEILNSLVMNQNLPPTVRTDAIETALRYRHQFKKNLKTENDHIRLSFVDDTLAQGFDQNIRYHDESQVFGHGVSALSEIEDYNTLGEALNFRMQKRNWEEDVRVPEEEFEVYKSSLKYFLDGTHNESTKEDVLNHLPHLINTILHKDPVALTARARLSQLLDNIKKTMQSLSPEERLYVADQTKLPEAASEWLKEKYKIFLDDLDLQKIGVCNEKADGKIVLKKQKSLKEDVEKIDQLSEKIQEKKALTDPHICLVSTYKLNDTDQLVLDRLLKLRAQRMKSLAIAYHALKSQGSEVEVPPLCKSEFHPFFDDEKNENTQSAWLTTRGKEKGISQEDMDTVNEARNNAKKTNKMSEEEWHKTLNKAIQDSYALADIQDDIRYFSEGGLHWRYGTEQGLLISEERRSQPHWVGYARPGVGEFPTSALFKDQARDSYYAPHLNQGRNLYEELHEKIKQNRAQYDALLVQTGGLAAGLVQEGVPFHDFVYKEVHLEDALLETTNHSDDYLKQFENLEDFPQSLWKPFWKNIFGDLKIPISSATTYSSPGNKENRGWNHHQERTIVDYPKLIGHLQHEIENMNLRVQDPHEWTQDGLKDRELATKYDRYKKALELIQKRYEEKMDTFKKEKGLELLKQARNYNDKKLNSYLEELCLDGHYGTDSEKIEKLRYLALDEKLRKETLSEENEKADCELTKNWESYQTWESRKQIGAQIGSGLLAGVIAGKALATGNTPLFLAAVAGEGAAAIGIDAYYYGKKKTLADKLTTAYQASGGKFGTSQTLVEYEHAAQDALNDFWFSVASAPVGILFHAKGIAILGRAARALKGARRFNDARHVLHAKGLLSQSKKLWKLNPKKAQSLLEEAKIILGKIGAQDPDVQLAQSLLGEVEEVGIRMTRGRQLEKAYKPLRKFAHDHLVDEGVQLSRLSGGELKAARLQAIGRMTRLMKAAGVAVDNPQSLENFGQVLKQNPQFRTHATKIFKAYGNDDTLLKETISEVGGFSEWAPMAANLAEHFEDPNDIKKFFDQVIGALKPQVSKIGTPIGFSPEQYDDFLRQLKDPHSPLFQNFKSTISCS